MGRYCVFQWRSLSSEWKWAYLIAALHFWTLFILVILTMDDSDYFPTLDGYISTIDFPVIFLLDCVHGEAFLKTFLGWGEMINFYIYYTLIAGSLFYFFAGYFAVKTARFILTHMRNRNKPPS